jgi:hypothetical protein
MQASHTLGATAKGTRCQGIYVPSRLYRRPGRPAEAGRAVRQGGTRQYDNLGLATNGAILSGDGVLGGLGSRIVETRVGGEIHVRQIDAKSGHLFCGYLGTNYKTNMPSGVGRLAVNEGQMCIP